MSERAALRRLLRRPRWSTAIVVAIVVVLLVLPLYVETFWLETGLFCMAAVVGAIGLNLAVGTAGQLSLAHAFFLAVGAYAYSYFAGAATATGGGVEVSGLGLPTLLAMALAVIAAGVAGLLFSPVAGRLRGIYLGVASLGLVFLGQHVLFSADAVTGGFYGRYAPTFNLFGFHFDDSPVDVLGTPFGQHEKLWYLFLAVAVGAALFARNVVRGRQGRALQLLRDSEVAAAVNGINVTRYKTYVFVLSSMYAGLAGVLIALAFRRAVPDYFGLDLSISYLAMIVIGGLGSVTGAAIGATFVTALPLVLNHYSDSLTFLAAPGSGGVDATVLSHFIYGGAVVLVILLSPEGLVGIGRLFDGGQRLLGRTGTSVRRRRSAVGEDTDLEVQTA